MEEAHQGFGGGHFAANIIACKIMLMGYWWPMLFKDFATNVHCQQCPKPRKQDFMPPYQNCDGLEIVMPWEFLVPSLRISKIEKWDGNELYDCIKNLEKLDEKRHIML